MTSSLRDSHTQSTVHIIFMRFHQEQIHQVYSFSTVQQMAARWRCSRTHRTSKMPLIDATCKKIFFTFSAFIIYPYFVVGTKEIIHRIFKPSSIFILCIKCSMTSLGWRWRCPRLQSIRMLNISGRNASSCTVPSLPMEHFKSFIFVDSVKSNGCKNYQIWWG